MLTEKNVYAYRKYFDTDNCAFAEPGNQIMIFNEKTNTYHVSPPKETNETFMNRLERCKEEQRNLFLDEWQPFNYEDGKLY